MIFLCCILKFSVNSIMCHWMSFDIISWYYEIVWIAEEIPFRNCFLWSSQRLPEPAFQENIVLFASKALKSLFNLVFQLINRRQLWAWFILIAFSDLSLFFIIFVCDLWPFNCSLTPWRLTQKIVHFLKSSQKVSIVQNMSTILRPSKNN